MAEDYKWICLIIGRQFSKKDGLNIVTKEIKNTFDNDDFNDLVIVDSNAPFVEGEQYYSFLKCKNYKKYVLKLKRCPVILDVLPTFENPYFISEEEVYSFEKSAKESKNPAKLNFGDLVRVEKGLLQNLKGFVVKQISENEYSIMFKLYTRCFHEALPISDLAFEKSLFDKIRVPVLSYGNSRETGCAPVGPIGPKAALAYMGRISSENKVHKPEHREHCEQEPSGSSVTDSEIHLTASTGLQANFQVFE